MDLLARLGLPADWLLDVNSEASYVLEQSSYVPEFN